jgi:GWxTD domain-containing protein
MKTALAVCLLFVAVTSGFAQDVSSKIRKVKKEPATVLKDWAKKDVPYIITDAERKAYEALKTDEERENFIAKFWDRRDPDPDTEENEFRTEYYERIAYANEHFTAAVPGWRTDRGQVYITRGKPDSIDSHPSGGTYDRPSYQGGGTTATYPFEIWFYRHLDGIGDGIEVEFVDATGSGDYRMARSPFEKDALAMNSGLSITNGAPPQSGSGYIRDQDTLFGRMDIERELRLPPRIKFPDLLTNTDSPVIDNNPLDFDLRVDFFRQSDTQVITAFTLQTDNRELTFSDVGGRPTAKMNILGRITAISGKRSGIFEDAATAVSSAEDLSAVKDRKSIYQKAYALTPGKYKVDVVVRDVVSGSRGIRTLSFTVPSYDPSKLSASTLILASRLYAATDGEGGGMFVIGGTKVVPNVSGIFKKGEDVGVYLQVYNAGVDETTLRPSVDVDYVLLKSNKEVLRRKEDWSGLSDTGTRLNLARLLPTANLEPGDYEIRIVIKDRVSGQTPEIPSAKFTLAP